MFVCPSLCPRLFACLSVCLFVFYLFFPVLACVTSVFAFWGTQKSRREQLIAAISRSYHRFDIQVRRKGPTLC